MNIIQSNHIRVCNFFHTVLELKDIKCSKYVYHIIKSYTYEYVTLTVTAWLISHGHIIRDRLGQSTESIHGRYPWTGGYIIWGKGIQGEYVSPGGDVQSLMILYELMIMVSKKLHVSILLLYKNVCINFVTYKFCYRINNVCINFVSV